MTARSVQTKLPLSGIVAVEENTQTEVAVAQSATRSLATSLALRLWGARSCFRGGNRHRRRENTARHTHARQGTLGVHCEGDLWEGRVWGMHQTRAGNGEEQLNPLSAA